MLSIGIVVGEVVALWCIEVTMMKIIGVVSCSGMLHGVEPATRSSSTAGLTHCMVSQMRSWKPCSVLESQLDTRSPTHCLNYSGIVSGSLELWVPRKRRSPHAIHTSGHCSTSSYTHCCLKLDLFRIVPIPCILPNHAAND